jgi:hypothetical protein
MFLSHFCPVPAAWSFNFALPFVLHASQSIILYHFLLTELSFSGGKQGYLSSTYKELCNVMEEARKQLL